MASLAKLYRDAKNAGLSASDIRGKSAEEITEMLNGSGGTTTATKKRAKAVVKKAVAKKRGRPAGSKNKTTATAPAKKRGRGRPKGSKNSTTTTAPKKRGRPAKATSNGNGGRHLLSKVNYSKADGWNPRAGSPPDRIVSALKRFKGDREKVFNHLKGDIWDFMGKTKRNGEKRSKPEAESMLRYRIARTDWQFAMQTGQHEKSENRAEYGTAGTGEGTFKRGKTSSSTPAKRGRPAKKASGRAQKPSKAPARASVGNAKEMSDKALRKYVKGFEGKRGRRPAEYAAAVKEIAKRERKAKKA